MGGMVVIKKENDMATYQIELNTETENLLQNLIQRYNISTEIN